MLKNRPCICYIHGPYSYRAIKYNAKCDLFIETAASLGLWTQSHYSKHINSFQSSFLCPHKRRIHESRKRIKI